MVGEPIEGRLVDDIIDRGTACGWRSPAHQLAAATGYWSIPTGGTSAIRGPANNPMRTVIEGFRPQQDAADHGPARTPEAQGA